MLALLPAELRADASPEFCTCRVCNPLMGPVEREQHETAAREWNAARKSWCNAHGFGLAELLVAEHGRGAPSKRRNATDPDGDRRPGEAITE